MNEECRLNRAMDDKGFCERLHSSLESNKYFYQLRLKSQRPEFVIQHYAEHVCYQVQGLIEKNKVRR
jgi:myosin heavy subunit